MKKYRVLWFDDKHESLETIKDDALAYGVELVGFENADDGLSELDHNYKYYDAVVVDGLFFNKRGQTGDAVDNSAFGRVAVFLTRLKNKGIVIPWFIFSGQPSFVKERNDLVMVLADKNFGNGKVYDKNNDEDFDELCKEIIKSANEIENTIIRLKYSDVFEVFTDEYIGMDSAVKILDALKFVEYEQKYTDTVDLFTGIRKVVEVLIGKLHDLGLIPDEIYNNNGWINQSSYFLSGTHDKYRIKEGIIQPATSFILKTLLQISQDASHETPEKLKLKIGQYVRDIQTPYLYKSVVFLLLDILIWFKKFVDDNPDIEANKALWEPVPSETKTLFQGIIEQDANGNFFCGEYLLNYTFVNANYKVGDQIQIIESSENTQTKTKHLYSKFGAKIIKKNP